MYLFISWLGIASVTGIEDVSAQGRLQLMPNPNGGTFTVAGMLQYSGQTVWEVTDALGQVIFREQVAVVQGSIRKEIRLGSDAAAGVYFLKITGSGNMAVLRFVVGR